MAIILSQQLTRYYDEYSSLDVTFTKDVVKATRLVTKQVFLKCLGYQWPCIIYSSSMLAAKIIVNAKLAIQDIAKKANNVVSLRFSFQTDKVDPVSFYVSCRVAGFTPYGAANPGLNIIAPRAKNHNKFIFPHRFQNFLYPIGCMREIHNHQRV